MDTDDLPVLTAYGRTYAVIDEIKTTSERQVISAIDITDVKNLYTQWVADEKLVTVKLPERLYEDDLFYIDIPVALNDGGWQECPFQRIEIQIIVVGRKDAAN